MQQSKIPAILKDPEALLRRSLPSEDPAVCENRPFGFIGGWSRPTCAFGAAFLLLIANAGVVESHILRRCLLDPALVPSTKALNTCKVWVNVESSLGSLA